MRRLIGSTAALLLARAVLWEICCTLIVVALLALNVMRAACINWLVSIRNWCMRGVDQFASFLRSVPSRIRAFWDDHRSAFTRKQLLLTLFLLTVIVTIFIVG